MAVMRGLLQTGFRSREAPTIIFVVAAGELRSLLKEHLIHVFKHGGVGGGGLSPAIGGHEKQGVLLFKGNGGQEAIVVYWDGEKVAAINIKLAFRLQFKPASEGGGFRLLSITPPELTATMLRKHLHTDRADLSELSLVHIPLRNVAG